MTNDKALEAAARAIASEMPLGKMDRAAHVAALAISAFLSALPGEVEVVEFRGDAEKIRWLSAERERLIKDAVNVATQRNDLLLSLQAMQARAEKAERERDEARLDRITAERDAQNMANQLVAAEARVKELEEALAYAVKGLDMIHNGLMDPTRPRQSVGEVCAHFLSTALKGGSNG